MKILIFLCSVLMMTSCNSEKASKPDATPKMEVSNLNTGGVDGGGGKGIVCRDSSNNIKSAEILDLYEGRTMYGLEIIKSSEPMDAQIDKALEKLSNNLSVSAFVSLVKKKMVLLPPDTELVPVDDSFEALFPKDCKAEQLAHYYSDEKVLINGDIWNHLTETDRAALILHEAIYRLNRSVGAKDSRQSRHVVMSLFDPNAKWTNPEENIPTEALTCMSTKGGLLMKVFKNANDAWTFQFQILGNNLVFNKKIAVLYYNYQNVFDFNEAKTFPVSEDTDKIGMIATGLTTYSDFEGEDTITIKRQWEPIGDYKTPRYYLGWKSGTFSNLRVDDQLLNCSITFPK